MTEKEAEFLKYMEHERDDCFIGGLYGLAQKIILDKLITKYKEVMCSVPVQDSKCNES